MKEAALTYTAEQLAELLGVSRGAVYRGVREGRIPAIRLGKRIILPRAAIDRWLEDTTIEDDAGEPRRTLRAL